MRVETTLREALSDDRLLGRALPGPTWHTWRSLLLACMGEALTDAELETFQAVTGRETAPTERCEELIAIVGRRGGKSRAISVLATYLACLIDYRDVLVPGERGLLLCIAPDQKQASIVRDYAAGIIEESPVLRPLLESQTRTEIRLSNGIDIETRAANWRRLRGVTCIAAVADESCFWFDESSSTNPDTEILNAIRPALITTRGLLAIISTPYARRGATWEAFQRHYGPEGDPGVLVATGASATFNSSLDPRVIERALERDPAAARSEYLGEWRSDISAFLSRDAVIACVDSGCHERPPMRGVKYAAHVDPSGGSNDSFTLAISHREGDQAVLDLLREARPPFSPETIVAEFCQDLARYGITTITGDRYAGEWPREQFRKRDVSYKVADKTASQMFVEALPLINAGTARLLDHKRLVDQLCALERRTAFGSNRDSVGHPPGGHDDLAVVAAGALLNASARPRTCWSNVRPDATPNVAIFDLTKRQDREPKRLRIKTIKVTEAEAEKEGIRLWP